MIDGGLHAVTVEDGSPHVVVVEARGEVRMQFGLFGVNSVNNSLVQVCCAKSPDTTNELDVVTVVHLGQVIEGAGLLRKLHDVFAPVVIDLDVALFDIDVRGPVLAHRSQLDKMRFRSEVSHRVDDVQRSDNIVDLSQDRVTSGQHREGSGSVLTVVNDGLWIGFLEDRL